MKVLMLGWELPPHNSGGLGVACYQLCEALARTGADIEFVLPYTAEHNISFMQIHAAHPQDVAEVQKAGIAYDSFKYIKHTGEIQTIDVFGQTAIYEQAVSRIVTFSKFDVIHAHDWLTCRAAIRAKQITGKPLIVHIHSIEADRAGREFSGNPLVREIEAQAVLLADKVIAVSQRTKDAIVREYAVPPSKIEVAYNTFDQTNLLPASGDTAYVYLDKLKKQGYKVVASIGRITVQKGLPNLLHAFKLVVTKAPKTMLLMVGSGEQHQELVLLAAQLGISKNVIFTDFQRGKRYRDAFAIADLFVMPSVSEPFGLTPLEAIGYGTPVLISKQSGVAEVLKNALKVDFWDINQMANMIVSVVQNPGLQQTLLDNATEEFNKLSWGDTADKLNRLYRQHMGAVSL